jgi:hypothetical protein
MKVTPSNLVGTFLMTVGGCLIVLWLLGDLGVLETKSGILTYILATVACLGIGFMLRAGQADKLGEAFMWWFKRGKRGPDE